MSEFPAIAGSGRVFPLAQDQALQTAAQEMEAAFLAEMLKSAGLGKVRDSFGGGAGEEQFVSFLREKQAEQMARHGGIGLSESIFEALKRRVADGE